MVHNNEGQQHLGLQLEDSLSWTTGRTRRNTHTLDPTHTLGGKPRPDASSTLLNMYAMLKRMTAEELNTAGMICTPDIRECMVFSIA